MIYLANAIPLTRLQQNLNIIAAHAFQRSRPFFVPFKSAVHPIHLQALPLGLALPYPHKGEGQGIFSNISVTVTKNV